MANPLRSLSRRERQIMDVLYRRRSATVAEVLEEMADPPSYSAVRATLRVMEEKGVVGHRQEGPRYVYEPVVEPEKARRAALRDLVRTFFEGSTEQALVALLEISDTKLPQAEIERLAERVRRARKEGR